MKADGFENQYLFVLSREFTDLLQDNPLFRAFRMLDAGYFPNAKYHFRERFGGIDESVLLLCVAGEGYYKIGEAETVRLKAGQAVLLPPDITHTYGASEEKPWSIYWFHYTGEASKELGDMLTRYQPMQTTTIETEQCVQLMKQSFDFLKRPLQSDEYFIVCQNALKICTILNYAAKQKEFQLTEKGGQAIQTAIQFMKENLHTSLSLAQISAATKFSSSHLHTMFKATTGQSPIDYFLHMKMHAASKELYFSECTVREVAAMFGIEDTCYFSRIFKKIIGMTPLEYRKLTKG